MKLRNNLVFHYFLWILSWNLFQGARDKIVGDGEGEEESNNGTEVVTTIGPMMPDEYVYVPSLFPTW